MTHGDVSDGVLIGSCSEVNFQGVIIQELWIFQWQAGHQEVVGDSPPGTFLRHFDL